MVSRAEARLCQRGAPHGPPLGLPPAQPCEPPGPVARQVAVRLHGAFEFAAGRGVRGTRRAGNAPPAHRRRHSLGMSGDSLRARQRFPRRACIRMLGHHRLQRFDGRVEPPARGAPARHENLALHVVPLRLQDAAAHGLLQTTADLRRGHGPGGIQFGQRPGEAGPDGSSARHGRLQREGLRREVALEELEHLPGFGGGGVKCKGADGFVTRLLHLFGVQGAVFDVGQETGAGQTGKRRGEAGIVLEGLLEVPHRPAVSFERAMAVLVPASQIGVLGVRVAAPCDLRHLRESRGFVLLPRDFGCQLPRHLALQRQHVRDFAVELQGADVRVTGGMDDLEGDAHLVA